MRPVVSLDTSQKYASVSAERTDKYSPRRDSLSSSKTADSGYMSDPDISLSPLDFTCPDQSLFTVPAVVTPLSSKPSDSLKALLRKRPPPTDDASGLELWKKHKPVPSTFETSLVIPTSEFFGASQGRSAARVGVQVIADQPDSHATFDIRPKTLNCTGVSRTFNQDYGRKSSVTSLSSTESCDMYSNVDDMSDDEALSKSLVVIPKQVLTTIEFIMRKVELNLNYASFRQFAGGSRSGSRPRANEGNLVSGGAGKRRSNKGDNHSPDDPNDDGSNKKRRASLATTTEDSESGLRFACPFFKHDPDRYRHRRTCPGPGWPTVHRMKEHLYRSHVQPVFCPRCYATFDSEADFAKHLRAAPCPVSAPQPLDGIDRETVNSLRKRSIALRLEEDKWRDVYHLLFPHVAETDIPSPYYDSDSPTEASRRFRREILARIRRELFTVAEQEPGPAEQTLLRQVAGIIQRCETELLRDRMSTSALLQPSLTNSRRGSAMSGQTDEPDTPPPQAWPNTSFDPDAVYSHGDTRLTAPPGRVSPRTRGFGQTLQVQESNHVARPKEPPSGDAELLPGFVAGDWIDWNAIFWPPPDTQ